MTLKTVFLDAASLDRGDIDMSVLESVVGELVTHDRSNPADVPDRVRDAECLMVNKVMVNDDVLEAAPALKLICVVATGTNNIDLNAARRRGVRVVNCRGYGTASVSQHVIALILALARSLPRYAADAVGQPWREAPFFCLLDHPIREMEELTLGVVGYGELGQATATLAGSLGMTVRVAERPGADPVRADRVAFMECLETSDVITLHCPLTDATRHLIGAPELRRMRRHALLINTARGGIVDETALRDALVEGRIGGAGVDVLTEEPPRHGNPLLDTDIPNLIVTPHCAWGSRRARERVLAQTVENIRGFLAGNVVRVVE